MARSPNLESVSTRPQRIAQLVRNLSKVIRTRGCATGLPDCVAKPWPEEPYAVVPHVGVCGGPGWATTQVYPATDHGSERVVVKLWAVSTDRVAAI